MKGMFQSRELRVSWEYPFRYKRATGRDGVRGSFFADGCEELAKCSVGAVR
jgi:hypothetical protein